MSTVLSCSIDSFNIIMSDTRVTTLNEHREKHSNDDNLKVHFIEKYGFITGIGIGDLASRTFDYFKKEYVKNEETLYKAYLCAYESIHNNGSDEVCRHLNRSAVITSNKEKITVFSHSFQTIGGVRCCLKKNRINILYPLDIMHELQEKLNVSVQLIDDWVIDQVLLSMLEAFIIISEKSEDVSDICNIAIMGKTMESPFFIQGKVFDVIDNIRNLTYYGLDNQFESYRVKLSEWS